MIKAGSKWTGAEGTVFVVINTLLIEDKTWVYYRLEKTKDHLPKEFSCFEESFLTRFRPLLD